MAIFIQLGIYSNQGADGIINGTSDRKAAMEKMLGSVGAKLLEYHITRGKYDFVMLSESDSFESVAACALKARAAGTLSELPIYIDDTPLQGIVDIRNRCRRMHMERKLDFIIIDYLQLIQGTGRRENRVQEVGEITRSLKGLARDLNLPVLALSQLSRAVDVRPSHRPQLSDLRESGSIEQDADVVMFIHREDRNLTENEWYEQHPNEEFPNGLADLIVAKHRHGPLGTIKLRFNGAMARFEDTPTYREQ
mgnify:CR=1 FL=1